MVKSEVSFEISNIYEKENLPEESWKVRPCEFYKDEYKECKSIRARFHQYFIYGEQADCSQWYTDYENCQKFRNKNDLDSLGSVIESENKRIESRKITKKRNDVWEYRSEPPENWNSPMPEWMIEKKRNSLLVETQNSLDQGIIPPKRFSGISCTIM